MSLKTESHTDKEFKVVELYVKCAVSIDRVRMIKVDKRGLNKMPRGTNIQIMLG